MIWASQVALSSRTCLSMQKSQEPPKKPAERAPPMSREQSSSSESELSVPEATGAVHSSLCESVPRAYSVAAFAHPSTWVISVSKKSHPNTRSPNPKPQGSSVLACRVPAPHSTCEENCPTPCPDFLWPPVNGRL